MAENVEILKLNGDPAVKTLKDLKDEVKSLRQQLDGCKVGSQEFQQTLDKLTATQQEVKDATKGTNDALEGSYDALVQKMGELKKIWRSTTDEVTRADIGEQIAKINAELKDMDASIGNYQRNVGDYRGQLEGMTVNIGNYNEMVRALGGSFDLVEGGLKAMGIESEGASKALAKMKGLMVMTNGLNSVKEGIGAFKSLTASIGVTTSAQWSLNAAMDANPIGAIIAVVTVLITALTALVSWMNTAGDSAESLAEQNDKLTDSLEKQNYELDYNIRLMKAKGATELEQLKADYQGKLKIAQDYYQEYLKMYNEANDSKRWFGLASSISDDEQAELDKAYQKYLDLHAEYKKSVDNYNLAVIESNRKRQEQEEKDAADSRKRARDLANARIAEVKREIEETNKLYQRQAKERSEYWLNELQLQLKRAEEWAEEEKEVVRKQYANKMITEQEYLDQIFEIDRIFADKKAKIYEKAELASIEYFEDGTAAFVEGEKVKQAALDETADKVDKVTWKTMTMGEKMNAAAGLASTAFGQTAQLLNTLANTQDKTTEEGFENYKKLAIGAAVMSMLQGIISSWTSAMSLPAPISFITGGVMSAATATLGAIQIDQIKKQSFSNTTSSSGSSTSSLPNVNTAALLSTPVNYTSEVQGARAEEDMVDTRVYVVESDITNTVNKVRTAETESVF